MNDQPILFSDGRNVRVTDKELIVDSARYVLKSIARARIHFISHFKYPAYTIIAMGIAGIMMGAVKVFTNAAFEELYIGDFPITANRLSILIGAILFFLGAAWLYVLTDKYALVISTTDGERNPISSRRKKYIRQIVSAINSANGIKSSEA